MSDRSDEPQAAPAGPKPVRPWLVVPLGILTVGLYPVWAFVPRLARLGRGGSGRDGDDEATDAARPPTGRRAWHLTAAWIVPVSMIV
ncbi:MAG: hypothetical protein ACYS9X_31045, partial [Planctomycetota bacterium]